MNNIENIQEYIPTVYVNDSEPDLDETNLNKTEQAIKRVTDAANKAIDALKQLDREKLALSAISNVLSDATDKVPSLALANTMQLAINDLNSNLSDKTNTSDFNNLKNSIVMVNVTGFAIGIDGNNVIIQWLNGENREFGYALNIGITDGTMQFFYRENGTWKPSWNK